MTFSEMSKSLRKGKNLSQVQLAEALKVSKACISMIEIGKNEPTANTLMKYADFFNCSTDYLLGRADDLGVISIESEKSDLSKDERSAVETLRALPEDLRRRALAYLSKLSELADDER